MTISNAFEYDSCTLNSNGGLIRGSRVSIAVDAPNLEFTSTVTLIYADYPTRSNLS